MKRIIQCFLVFVSVVYSINTFAFDQNRKGFFLSVGGGLQSVSVDEVNFGAPDEARSIGGFATSFKVGSGLTEQFALYYVRNLSWFDASVSSRRSFMYTSGIAGVGGSYYFNENTRSAYVLGAVGFGDFDAPFAVNIEPKLGSAVMLGVGYEFSKRKAFEATALFIDVGEDSTSDDFGSAIQSIQLTYNYMWY